MNRIQSDRFYALLRELMMYANGRLRCVRDFDLNSRRALDDPSLEEKCQIILQELWQTPDLIDDFVAENAYRLPKDAVGVALSWKDALFSVYTFAAVKDGIAIAFGEDEVFAVQGVAESIESMLPHLPVSVEGALLPYEGAIVLQEPFRVLGAPPYPLDPSLIDDAFLTKNPPISSAVDFSLVARLCKDRNRQKELDYMLNGSELEDEPSPGFHKGALSGVDEDERARLSEEEEGRVLRPMLKEAMREQLERYMLRNPVEPVLGHALMAINKMRIENVARRAGLKGCSNLRKADLAERLILELTGEDRLARLRGLVYLGNDSQLVTLENVLKAGGEWRASDGDLAPSTFDPFVFVYREDGEWHAFAPMELRDDEVLGIVRDELESRERDDRAAAVLEACASQYGVISLEEAYREYLAMEKDALPFARFRYLASGELEEVCSTGLCSRSSVEYLISYELTERRLAAEAMLDLKNEVYEKAVRSLGHSDDCADEWREGAHEALLEEFEEEWAFDRVQERLSELQLSNDAYIDDLIKQHAGVARCPLNRSMVERSWLEVVCESPEGIALRNFMDGQVPDGENDYFFADRFVEDVANSMLSSGTVEGAFRYIRQLGYDENAPSTVKLTRLAANLYNVIPSWENNGWTPREQSERITGRKIFYAPDGTVRKPGRNDPCPCGSGKKYKRCCGRG